MVLLIIVMALLPRSYLGSSLRTQHARELDINIPEYELQALHDLYNSTCGEQWTYGGLPGSKWTFSPSANPCTEDWVGVTCTGAPVNNYLHVESLYLESCGLVGSIPETLGNLSALSSITLGNNFLVGNIPTSVGRLNLLQQLVLTTNSLGSRIPVDVFRLPLLQEFSISTNLFSGPLPEEFCSMRTLSLLRMSYNYFTGTLPDCLGDMTNLTSLSLGHNSLYGEIPSSFGKLFQLNYLYLDQLLDLSGTIPPSFSELSSMHVFEVANNHLTGTIPSFFGNLAGLSEVDFSFNSFTGSISPGFCSLESLGVFLLFNNRLNGTIPACLSGLPNLISMELNNNMLSGPVQFSCNSDRTILQEADLSFNNLEGSLPQSIGACSTLLYVGFGSNRFEGSINRTFANLSHLIDLNLGYNQLTGGIPEYFSDLPLLKILLLNDNLLSSSIPDRLLAIPYLFALDVGDNALTGPLPVVGNIQDSQLLALAFGNNKLSGTIPPEYAAFTALVYLNVSGNLLHGSIAPVTNMTSLNYLYVSSNVFSGPLADNWNNQQLLSYFYADDNHFSGSVPSTMGLLNQLSNLNLSSNRLSGPLPSELSQLSKLRTMLFSDNALTGTLDSVFNATAQRSLSAVQFSNNELTGTLPVELFRIPSLTVFAAVSNCFDGSIPADICDCAALNTLALDGLQSATSCQNILFSGKLQAITSKSLYLIHSPLSGGIPTCLFQMPNLTTLHLSGNGLSGSLPSDVPLSASLTDLSLSHNMLEGSIPSSILGRKWLNLDLSYNRLTHGLSVNGSQYFAAQTSLSLEQNRLSGDIPSALQGVHPISLLESNLFHCNLQRSDLPEHDGTRGKYQCGSDTFNATLFAWLGMLLVAIAVTGACTWRYRSLCATYWLVLRRWWFAGHFVVEGGNGDVSAQVLPNYMQMCTLVDVILEMSIVCTVYAVLVLMPVYIVTTALFGTYTHQYAWTLSAIYTSGHTAFALLFVFWVLLIVLTVLGLALFARRRFGASSSASTTEKVSHEKISQSWRQFARSVVFYGVYILVNFVVVLGVNVAYVIVFLNEDGTALTLAQTSLAAFKVAYNGVCTPLITRWLSQQLHTSVDDSKHLLFVQLVVSLINNILIPCVVVAFVSPSCFYNAFKAPKAVTSSFTYLGNCLQFEVNIGIFVPCLNQEVLTATTSYNPPFAYSYQCSSSFVTYYAPAYVIMCIISGFLVPVMQTTALWLYNRAVPGTLWFKVLGANLPRIMKNSKSHTISENTEIVGQDVNSTSSSAHKKTILRPYVDINKHITTLLTYLCLVLTFGAVFPPLAVCFTVALGSIAAYARLKVGRFLEHAREQAGAAEMAESAALIEAECAGAGDLVVLRRAVGLMVTFGCLFYTLFLFDTLGDATGLNGAYWILIVMPLFPVVVFVAFRFVDWICVPKAPMLPLIIVSGNSEMEMHKATVKRNTQSKSPLHDISTL